MRILTLKAALAAILISAPFATAFAGADRSDSNTYQTEGQSFSGAASMNTDGVNSLGFNTPSSTQQDNGRR